MNVDLLRILQEVRGTQELGAPLLDGIYWDLTVKDYNGHDGIYGDILSMWQELKLPSGNLVLADGGSSGTVTGDEYNTALYLNTPPNIEPGTTLGVESYLVTNQTPVTSTITGDSLEFRLGDIVFWANDTWALGSVIGRESVTSVNEHTGAVSLTTNDIPEGLNLYFTEDRVNVLLQAFIDDDTASDTTTYSSSKIESTLSESLVNKGLWNAATNSPAISNASGTKNLHYTVSVAGTVDLGDGPHYYSLGSTLTHDGSTYVNVSTPKETPITFIERYIVETEEGDAQFTYTNGKFATKTFKKEGVLVYTTTLTYTGPRLTSKEVRREADNVVLQSTFLYTDGYLKDVQKVII